MESFLCVAAGKLSGFKNLLIGIKPPEGGSVNILKVTDVTGLEGYGVQNGTFLTDILKKGHIDSYLAFIGNVNADMVQAAMGKGCEDEIVMLGKQIAMYAWAKGESKEEHPYTLLKNITNLSNIAGNVNISKEIQKSELLCKWFSGFTYSREKIKDWVPIPGDNVIGFGKYSFSGGFASGNVGIDLATIEVKHTGLYNIVLTYINEGSGYGSIDNIFTIYINEENKSSRSLSNIYLQNGDVITFRGNSAYTAQAHEYHTYGIYLKCMYDGSSVVQSTSSGGDFDKIVLGKNISSTTTFISEMPDGYYKISQYVVSGNNKGSTNITISGSVGGIFLTHSQQSADSQWSYARGTASTENPVYIKKGETITYTASGVYGFGPLLFFNNSGAFSKLIE